MNLIHYMYSKLEPLKSLPYPSGANESKSDLHSTLSTFLLYIISHFIQYMARIWPYMVRISISLGFSYMVSISLGLPDMVMLQTFKCKHHCSGCGVAMGCYGCCIVPGAALVMSQCYGCYCFTEYALTWAEHLPMPWQCEFMAIMGTLSMDWFCRISMWFVVYFW